MKNENELRAELIERVNASSQTAVAKELQMSIGFIHDVIKGRRSVSSKLARKLGYRAEIIKSTSRTYFPITPV